jgi:hypothetical protein
MTRSILIKAISPCSIEKYKKDFDGIEVEIHREAFDNWNEVILEIPEGVEIPKPGESFSTYALGIEPDIQDISSGSDIQISIVTELDDEEIEEAIYEHEANDDWEEEWELIGHDYIIYNYEILKS